MIFTIIKRKNVKEVAQLIRKHNPTAFYSIEEIKNTSQGVFTENTGSGFSAIRKMFPARKGK